MRLDIAGSTTWPGWLLVPIVEGDLDDAATEWVRSASARLEEVWPGQWPGDHRIEALQQLDAVLRHRQELPDPIVFHAWPTPIPVGAVVRIGIMEAAGVAELLPTGEHDVLELPGLGAGIRMSIATTAAAPSGGTMDLATESIVFQDGEGAIVLTVAGGVAFMLAAVRPGLNGLLETMTATYEDGRPFRGVLSEGIVARERWDLTTDDELVEESR